MSIFCHCAKVDRRRKVIYRHTNGSTLVLGIDRKSFDTYLHKAGHISRWYAVNYSKHLPNGFILLCAVLPPICVGYSISGCLTSSSGTKLPKTWRDTKYPHVIAAAAAVFSESERIIDENLITFSTAAGLPRAGGAFPRRGNSPREPRGGGHAATNSPPEGTIFSGSHSRFQLIMSLEDLQRLDMSVCVSLLGRKNDQRRSG